MGAVALQLWTLWQREIIRFARQRSVIVGSFVQPLIFWVLIGWGFRASFRPSGMATGTDYVEYFYPGVIMLVLLFTAIFATIAIVDDRRQGFLQGVLVAPIARDTVVAGQALGGTTLALFQGCVFLVLAPLAGIRLGAAAVCASIAVMALIAFAFNCIGLLIAWRIESTRGFHLIMNSILVPIWFLSGAFFPAAGAPAWLRWVMWLIPFWLLLLPKGVEAGQTRTWARNLALLALAISALSVGYAMRNPWSHPWILDAMEHLGLYPLTR